MQQLENKPESDLALEQLWSGNCSVELNINLYKNNIGHEGVKAIANSLEPGKCSDGLHIDLGSHKIGAENRKAITDAFQLGKYPDRLNIDLSYNKIGAEGAKAIADALQSGKCSDKLNINLYHNNIGEEGAKVIANAFESGKCPGGLNINLGSNNLGNEGAKVIARSLESVNCPNGLNINLYYNNIDKEWLDQINRLVEKNNNYHEFKAFNRFASIRTFFMSTQDFFPKELRIFIGSLCLQNYDLTLNKRFTCMNSIKLQKMEIAASQLIELPEKSLGHNPGFFQTQESRNRAMGTAQQLKVEPNKGSQFGCGS